MKSLFSLLLIIALLQSISSNGQIKNAKTLSLKINGNCEMCEKTIETAANKKNVVKLDWNKDTKQATIIYDDSKTNPDEILKRVALAGYDNEKFLAPDDAYASLPDCCKYDRNRKKTEVKSDVVVSTSDKTEITNSQNTSVNQFKPIFDSYFELKNALVKTDSKLASVKARDLSAAISKLEMSKLEMNQHEIWMKVYKDLAVKTAQFYNVGKDPLKQTVFLI
jgi:copper chaperone CopZ